MKTLQVRHEFVEFIPKELAEGVLYVCIPYATVVHKCCCGCNYEVVTPLGRTDWSLTFDGESISLSPSIGNWSFPCRSHYWIRNNKVVRSSQWSDSQIRAGRDHDKWLKSATYSPAMIGEPVNALERLNEPKIGIVEKLLNWVRGRGK